MIYVDNLRRWPESAYRSDYVQRLGARYDHYWSHLFTDGKDEELHAFAERIGMKRQWAQGSGNRLHYDLVPPKRALAVRFGAKEVSDKAMLAIMKRAAAPLGYIKLRNRAEPWDGVRRSSAFFDPFGTPGWEDGFGSLYYDEQGENYDAEDD